MPRSWTAKNPAMSLFLSGANAWASAARGFWAAEATRQQNAVMKAGAKQMADLWMAGLAPASSRGRKSRKRR